MKKFIFIVSLLFSFSYLFAQIPHTMSYQGVLTDGNVNPVPDGQVNLTFRLYEVAEGGESLWVETQSVETKKGLFNVILGSSNPLALSFDRQYWLGITVEEETELIPRVPLTSSPYSLGSTATLVEPEPGQGLVIKNLSNEVTHKFTADGDGLHTGTVTFLNGIVVGDSIIEIDTTGLGGFSIKNNNKMTNSDRIVKVQTESNTPIKAKVGGNGTAIYGETENGLGVYGYSVGGNGVSGVSRYKNGVFGKTESNDEYFSAAVTGISLGNAPGVYGSSKQIGVEGEGPEAGVYAKGKLKVDNVPEAPGLDHFLVWDTDDNIVKYRTLPEGSTFNGVLQDKALIVKNGETVVFLVDTNGNSYHKGVEIFEKGIDLPDNDPENSTSNVKAGKFMGPGQLSTNEKLSSVRSPRMDIKNMNLTLADPNEPTIWGYTERIDGAAILGQSNNTGNIYPANWGINFGGGAGVVGEVRNTSSNYPAIWALEYGIGSGLLIDHQGTSGDIFIGRSDGVNQARIDKTGKGFFNGGTQTGGADIAEAFEVEGTVKEYEPGDVLIISTKNDRTVSKSNEPYSTLVVGVYATKPGVLLTELDLDDPLKNNIPMGVIGVIPTKVCNENGSIHRGDLLVTSSLSGYAMKGTDREKLTGTVLGKALENFDADTGVIKVLVNTK